MKQLFDIKRKTLVFENTKYCTINDIDFNDINMNIMDNDIARQFICSNHYSSSCVKVITVAFGFYYLNKLIGCIIYSQPVGRKIITSISDNLETTDVLELTRLFFFDNLPNNIESYAISKTIRYIKNNLNVKYLISYADSNFGHCGIIYQSTNWLYCGMTDKKVIFKINGKVIHSRSLFSRYGTMSISKLKQILGDNLEYKHSSPKYRYIYVLGKSKVERKVLMSELKYSIFEYPKLDIKYYRFI